MQDNKKEEVVGAMPVLFIGGPDDGKRIDMTSLPPTRTAKMRNPNFNALVAPGVNGGAEMMFIDVTYRREAFRTSAGLYPVYVFEEIPQQDVMHFLLEGYRPVVETATKH